MIPRCPPPSYVFLGLSTTALLSMLHFLYISPVVLEEIHL